ncbi:MAG: hypothetical protein MUF31_10885, partial [Akkermansiaceae bacterium]|nr:hypothetical protein [Akkermansiaceae bacterium]
TSAVDDNRGFTGHEVLDDFGLIHMNGRIYDPELFHPRATTLTPALSIVIEGPKFPIKPRIWC